MSVGIASSEMSGTLTTGQWTTVYISYSISRNYGVAMLFIDGGTYHGFSSTYTAPNSTALSASDIVKVYGGFTGELRRMQIYSPGAFAVASNARNFIVL